MDNFREEIITRKSGKTLYNILYIVVFIFMILSSVFTLAYLMPVLNLAIDFTSAPGIAHIAVMLVAGVLTFLLWRNKDTLRIEYEYTLTNGEMDFAKVLGNTRRKHLLTVHLKTVEQGGMVDSDAFRRLSGGPNVKTIDLTLNRDVFLYFLYYSRDGVRNIIILEPSAEMIVMMRLYNRNLTA